MATSIPPHNVAEVLDAAAHLIDNPRVEASALMDFIAGPDFPTGGIIVDSAESIAAAYATGRGAFRVRAKWEIEKGPQGSWTAVITEVPYTPYRANVLRSAWIPAPPPESEPAIVSTIVRAVSPINERCAACPRGASRSRDPDVGASLACGPARCR